MFPLSKLLAGGTMAHHRRAGKINVDNVLCSSFNNLSFKKQYFYEDYVLLRNQLLLLEYSDEDPTVTSRFIEIVELLIRYIQDVPQDFKYSTEFVNDIHRKIMFLSDIVQTQIKTKVGEKLPIPDEFNALLVSYVELECESLHLYGNFSTAYKKQVENRVLCVLLNVIQSFDGRQKKLKKDSRNNYALGVLRILTGVQPEFKRQYQFFEDITVKLLKMLKILDKVRGISSDRPVYDINQVLHIPEVQKVYKYLRSQDDSDQSDEEVFEESSRQTGSNNSSNLRSPSAAPGRRNDSTTIDLDEEEEDCCLLYFQPTICAENNSEMIGSSRTQTEPSSNVNCRREKYCGIFTSGTCDRDHLNSNSTSSDFGTYFSYGSDSDIESVTQNVPLYIQNTQQNAQAKISSPSVGILDQNYFRVSLDCISSGTSESADTLKSDAGFNQHSKLSPTNQHSDGTTEVSVSTFNNGIQATTTDNNSTGKRNEIINDTFHVLQNNRKDQITNKNNSIGAVSITNQISQSQDEVHTNEIEELNSLEDTSGAENNADDDDNDIEAINLTDISLDIKRELLSDSVLNNCTEIIDENMLLGDEIIEDDVLLSDEDLTASVGSLKPMVNESSCPSDCFNEKRMEEISYNISICAIKTPADIIDCEATATTTDDTVSDDYETLDDEKVNTETSEKNTNADLEQHKFEETICDNDILISIQDNSSEGNLKSSDVSTENSSDYESPEYESFLDDCSKLDGTSKINLNDCGNELDEEIYEKCVPSINICLEDKNERVTKEQKTDSDLSTTDDNSSEDSEFDSPAYEPILDASPEKKERNAILTAITEYNTASCDLFENNQKASEELESNSTSMPEKTSLLKIDESKLTNSEDISDKDSKIVDAIVDGHSLNATDNESKSNLSEHIAAEISEKDMVLNKVPKDFEICKPENDSLSESREINVTSNGVDTSVALKDTTSFGSELSTFSTCVDSSVNDEIIIGQIHETSNDEIVVKANLDVTRNLVQESNEILVNTSNVDRASQIEKMKDVCEFNGEGSKSNNCIAVLPMLQGADLKEVGGKLTNKMAVELISDANKFDESIKANQMDFELFVPDTQTNKDILMEVSADKCVTEEEKITESKRIDDCNLIRYDNLNNNESLDVTSFSSQEKGNNQESANKASCVINNPESTEWSLKMADEECIIPETGISVTPDNINNEISNLESQQELVCESEETIISTEVNEIDVYTETVSMNIITAEECELEESISENEIINEVNTTEITLNSEDYLVEEVVTTEVYLSPVNKIKNENVKNESLIANITQEREIEVKEATVCEQLVCEDSTTCEQSKVKGNSINEENSRINNVNLEDICSSATTIYNANELDTDEKFDNAFNEHSCSNNLDVLASVAAKQKKMEDAIQEKRKRGRKPTKEKARRKSKSKTDEELGEVTRRVTRSRAHMGLTTSENQECAKCTPSSFMNLEDLDTPPPNRIYNLIVNSSMDHEESSGSCDNQQPSIDGSSAEISAKDLIYDEDTNDDDIYLIALKKKALKHKLNSIAIMERSQKSEKNIKPSKSVVKTGNNNLNVLSELPMIKTTSSPSDDFVHSQSKQLELNMNISDNVKISKPKILGKQLIDSVRNFEEAVAEQSDDNIDDVPLIELTKKISDIKKKSLPVPVKKRKPYNKQRKYEKTKNISGELQPKLNMKKLRAGKRGALKNISTSLNNNASKNTDKPMENLDTSPVSNNKTLPLNEICSKKENSGKTIHSMELADAYVVKKRTVSTSNDKEKQDLRKKPKKLDIKIDEATDDLQSNSNVQILSLEEKNTKELQIENLNENILERKSRKRVDLNKNEESNKGSNLTEGNSELVIKSSTGSIRTKAAVKEFQNPFVLLQKLPINLIDNTSYNEPSGRNLINQELKENKLRSECSKFKTIRTDEALNDTNKNNQQFQEVQNKVKRLFNFEIFNDFDDGITDKKLKQEKNRHVVGKSKSKQSKNLFGGVSTEEIKVCTEDIKCKREDLNQDIKIAITTKEKEIKMDSKKKLKTMKSKVESLQQSTKRKSKDDIVTFDAVKYEPNKQLSKDNNIMKAVEPMLEMLEQKVPKTEAVVQLHTENVKKSRLLQREKILTKKCNTLEPNTQKLEDVDSEKAAKVDAAVSEKNIKENRASIEATEEAKHSEVLQKEVKDKVTSADKGEPECETNLVKQDVEEIKIVSLGIEKVNIILELQNRHMDKIGSNIKLSSQNVKKEEIVNVDQKKFEARTSFKQNIGKTKSLLEEENSVPHETIYLDVKLAEQKEQNVESTIPEKGIAVIGKKKAKSSIIEPQLEPLEVTPADEMITRKAEERTLELLPVNEKSDNNKEQFTSNIKLSKKDLTHLELNSSKELLKIDEKCVNINTETIELVQSNETMLNINEPNKEQLKQESEELKTVPLFKKEETNEEVVALPTKQEIEPSLNKGECEEYSTGSSKQDLHSLKVVAFQEQTTTTKEEIKCNIKSPAPYIEAAEVVQLQHDNVEVSKSGTECGTELSKQNAHKPKREEAITTIDKNKPNSTTNPPEQNINSMDKNGNKLDMEVSAGVADTKEEISSTINSKEAKFPQLESRTALVCEEAVDLSRQDLQNLKSAPTEDEVGANNEAKSSKENLENIGKEMKQSENNAVEVENNEHVRSDRGSCKLGPQDMRLLTLETENSSRKSPEPDQKLESEICENILKQDSKIVEVIKKNNTINIKETIKQDMRATTTETQPLGNINKEDNTSELAKQVNATGQNLETFGDDSTKNLKDKMSLERDRRKLLTNPYPKDNLRIVEDSGNLSERTVEHSNKIHPETPRTPINDYAQKVQACNTEITKSMPHPNNAFNEPVFVHAEEKLGPIDYRLPQKRRLSMYHLLNEQTKHLKKRVGKRYSFDGTVVTNKEMETANEVEITDQMPASNINKQMQVPHLKLSTGQAKHDAYRKQNVMDLMEESGIKKIANMCETGSCISVVPKQAQKETDSESKKAIYLQKHTTKVDDISTVDHKNILNQHNVKVIERETVIKKKESYMEAISNSTSLEQTKDVTEKHERKKRKFKCVGYKVISGIKNPEYLIDNLLGNSNKIEEASNTKVLIETPSEEKYVTENMHFNNRSTMPNNSEVTSKVPKTKFKIDQATTTKEHQEASQNIMSKTAENQIKPKKNNFKCIEELVKKTDLTEAVRARPPVCDDLTSKKHSNKNDYKQMAPPQNMHELNTNVSQNVYHSKNTFPKSEDKTQFVSEIPTNQGLRHSVLKMMGETKLPPLYKDNNQFVTEQMCNRNSKLNSSSTTVTEEPLKLIQSTVCGKIKVRPEEFLKKPQEQGKPPRNPGFKFPTNFKDVTEIAASTKHTSPVLLNNALFIGLERKRQQEVLSKQDIRRKGSKRIDFIIEDLKNRNSQKMQKEAEEAVLALTNKNFKLSELTAETEKSPGVIHITGMSKIKKLNSDTRPPISPVDKSDVNVIKNSNTVIAFQKTSPDVSKCGKNVAATKTEDSKRKLGRKRKVEVLKVEEGQHFQEKNVDVYLHNIVQSENASFISETVIEMRENKYFTEIPDSSGMAESAHVQEKPAESNASDTTHPTDSVNKTVQSLNEEATPVHVKQFKESNDKKSSEKTDTSESVNVQKSKTELVMSCTEGQKDLDDTNMCTVQKVSLQNEEILASKNEKVKILPMPLPLTQSSESDIAVNDQKSVPTDQDQNDIKNSCTNLDSKKKSPPLISCDSDCTKTSTNDFTKRAPRKRSYSIMSAASNESLTTPHNASVENTNVSPIPIKFIKITDDPSKVPETLPIKIFSQENAVEDISTPMNTNESKVLENSKLNVEMSPKKTSESTVIDRSTETLAALSPPDISIAPLEEEHKQLNAPTNLDEKASVESSDSGYLDDSLIPEGFTDSVPDILSDTIVEINHVSTTLVTDQQVDVDQSADEVKLETNNVESDLNKSETTCSSKNLHGKPPEDTLNNASEQLLVRANSITSSVSLPERPTSLLEKEQPEVVVSLNTSTADTSTSCEGADSLIAVIFSNVALCNNTEVISSSEQNQPSKTGFIYFRGSDHNYHSVGDPLLGGECDNSESDHSTENCKEIPTPELENVLVDDNILPYLPTLTENNLNQEPSSSLNDSPVDNSSDFQLLEQCLIGNPLARESSPPLPQSCDESLYRANLKQEILEYDDSSTSSNIEFCKENSDMFINQLQPQTMSVENMSELMNAVMNRIHNLNNMTRSTKRRESVHKETPFVLDASDFNVKTENSETKPVSVKKTPTNTVMPESNFSASLYTQPQSSDIDIPETVSFETDFTNFYYLPVTRDSASGGTNTSSNKKVIVEHIPQLPEQPLKPIDCNSTNEVSIASSPLNINKNVRASVSVVNRVKPTDSKKSELPRNVSKLSPPNSSPESNISQTSLPKTKQLDNIGDAGPASNSIHVGFVRTSSRTRVSAPRPKKADDSKRENFNKNVSSSNKTDENPAKVKNEDPTPTLKVKDNLDVNSKDDDSSNSDKNLQNVSSKERSLCVIEDVTVLNASITVSPSKRNSDINKIETKKTSRKQSVDDNLSLKRQLEEEVPCTRNSPKSEVQKITSKQKKQAVICEPNKSSVPENSNQQDAPNASLKQLKTESNRPDSKNVSSPVQNKSSEDQFESISSPCDMIDNVKRRKRKPVDYIERVDYSSIEKLLGHEQLNQKVRSKQKKEDGEEHNSKLKGKRKLDSPDDRCKSKSKSSKTVLGFEKPAISISSLSDTDSKTYKAKISVFEDSDDDVPKKKLKPDSRLEPADMNDLFDRLVREGNVNNVKGNNASKPNTDSHMSTTHPITAQDAQKPNVTSTDTTAYVSATRSIPPNVTFNNVELPTNKKPDSSTPVKQIGVVNPIPRPTRVAMRKDLPCNRNSYGGNEDGRISSQYYPPYYSDRSRRSYSSYSSRETSRSSHQSSSSGGNSSSSGSRRMEYSSHASDQRYLSSQRSSGSGRSSSRSVRYHSNSRVPMEPRGYRYASGNDLSWRDDMKKKFPTMFKDEVYF